MPITIDGDSGISGVNGTAGTPALQGEDSNTGIVFGTDTVQVSTGGSTRATVDSSGNVGIGTSSPNSFTDYTTVTIQGTSAAGIDCEKADGTIQARFFGDATGVQIGAPQGVVRFQTGTSATERMRIDGSGKTGILANNSDVLQLSTNGGSGESVEFLRGMHSGTVVYDGTLTFRVFTNGDVENTNGDYGNISDIKLKENIVDAPSQWDDIKAVKFRKFNFKAETGHQTHTQLGVIAQELELTSPGLVRDVVDKDSDGNDLGTTTKSVKSSILTMKALVALQEAMERIETLETQHANLLARVTALEAA